MKFLPADICNPLVSVCIQTFNHENYIKECLESVLSQKTTFDFEILIHDDNSTDTTKKIIKRCKSKHNSLIGLIIQDENQRSKGLFAYPNFLFPKSRGKYIAICDGDDYWTDPYKLQKQVDFLEGHQNYSMVFTDYSILNMDGIILSSTRYSKKNLPVVDYFNQLLIRNIIGALTVCIKKDVVHHYISTVKDVSKQWAQGDKPLWLYASVLGKIGYIDEVTSVYRRHQNTASNWKNKTKQAYFVLSNRMISNYFIRMYPEKVDANVKNKCEINLNKAHLDYAFMCVNYRESFKYFIKIKKRSGLKKSDYIKLFGSINKLFNKIALQILKIR